jgi:hypothetical protein
MRRRAAAVLVAILPAVLAAGSLRAAEPGRGLYEDPLGRYRFAFEGQWQVGLADEGTDAPDRFFLINQQAIAAELIISSKPFPASSRFSDFVEAEVAALDAEPDMLKVSLTTGLTISGQPAVRLIARAVGLDERGMRRETFAVQYWFVKSGQLWSLVVLTTGADQQRSKVVFTIEETVISSFEALEPDEVTLAIADSKKVARLGDGLAEITLPERWTLLAVGDDRVAAEFDKGRLYLFVVTDHDYGDTLKEVAHRFVENHASLDSPKICLEGDCDVHGEPGYFVVLDGDKDGVAFRAQLIALTRGGNAFFLYGLCAVDAWPQARSWITAVQYTINFVEQAPASSSSSPDENAE